MARYLLLLRNNSVGAARMLDALTTGFDALPSQLEPYGGTVEQVYALTGRYDAAVLADFESPEGVLAFSLAATADGEYVEALPAFGRGELARAEEIARAAALAFEARVAAAAPPDPAGGGGGEGTG
jgi:uncharacterized protein with GYD domain